MHPVGEQPASSRLPELALCPSEAGTNDSSDVPTNASDSHWSFATSMSRAVYIKLYVAFTSTFTCDVRNVVVDLWNRARFPTVDLVRASDAYNWSLVYSNLVMGLTLAVGHYFSAIWSPVLSNLATSLTNLVTGFNFVPYIAACSP